jgi:hypothetical protein
MSKTKIKLSWTVVLEEADDGSGDLIMPFPDALLEEAGWKEGDVLEWIDNENGSYSLRKLNETT